MTKTLKMRMHLYFAKTETNKYLPNAKTTTLFLAHGMSGLKNQDFLMADEFDLLKSKAKENGLIIHVFDGESEIVYE